GRSASYGRLREACQTDVDGTSIDTIEEIAVELGLGAVQTLLPLDHVVPRGDQIDPAIVVVRGTFGPHFVVMWNRAFGRVQLMDPGRGRRWISDAALVNELYVHEMDVPAADWRDAVGEDEFRRVLVARMHAIGIADAERRVASALDDAGWKPIATLDAATR